MKTPSELGDAKRARTCRVAPRTSPLISTFADHGEETRGVIVYPSIARFAYLANATEARSGLPKGERSTRGHECN